MDKDEIVKDLSEHYSKKALSVIAMYLNLKSYESLNKEQLINLIIDTFNSNQGFEILYSRITREAQIVLNHLVWYGVSTLRHIESKYHIKISLDDFYGNTNDPFIKNFKSYYSKEILLSNGLRFLFKKHIKMPSDGDIVTSENLPDNIYAISGSDYVLKNIEAINEFIIEEGIQKRDLSKKILVKSLNRFGALFDFNDPFCDIEVNDRGMKDLGKTVLLRLLCYLEESDNPVSSLEHLIKKYSNGNLDDDNIDYYLFYPFIKGITKQYSLPIFLKRARFSVLSRIKSFSIGEWINVDSLIKSISLEEETHIFDTSYFGSTMHVKVDSEFTRDYSDKIDLTYKEDNEVYLVSPLCRGIITFLYTVGAVNLGIDRYGENRCIAASKSYLTPFDYISHFKLTDLGLKLLGLKSNYNFKRSGEFSLTFSKTKRIISLTGKDKSLKNFLTRIGEEIGEGTFIVSFKSFISSCQSEEDIYYNIDRLKKLLKDNIPEVWKKFISEMDDRIYPAYNEQELIVVNFPRENDLFIETVVNNSKIRKLYSMVEDFRGAFSKKNYNLFKKYMKDEGFYI